METQIGIKPEHAAKVAVILNSFLADEFILFLQTRKAHWNIESENFYYLHVFFEEQYKQIDLIADDIAERIRTIGHYATASCHEYLALTHLTEITNQGNDGNGHLRNLLSSHETIIINMRSHIEQFVTLFQDAGTGDFITGVMEVHEKMAWMIKSHLK